MNAWQLNSPLGGLPISLNMEHGISNRNLRKHD